VRKLWVMLFLVPFLNAASMGALPQNQAQAGCGQKCGEERWPVKTLTGSDASWVNFSPVSNTVGAPGALPASKGNCETSRVNKTEETTVSGQCSSWGPIKHNR